jgi:hypothetical protein
MKNSILKSLLPIVSAIAIFIALTFVYFSPMIKGKVLRQGDIVATQGMAKEVNDFRDKYHEEPLWTNSMFGGMPAYMISVRSQGGSVVPHFRTLITLGMSSPAVILFSYMIGFFILLIVLRVNPWLSIIGSVAFAFSSYTLIILEAGHVSKAFCISYIPPVFASVILICRKKYLLGSSLLALFMALELQSSHVQITYYLLMFLVIYVVFEFIQFIKEKQYYAIGKSLLSFVVAAILAFGCNTSNLLNAMDYVKYTIRGKSELTNDASNKTSGLDRDYVVQWSMGKAETMSLMIPGFKGRSSSMLVKENPGALKNVEEEMKEPIGSGIGQYWGDQPFTSACYAGAAIVFLFVLGLFIIEGRIKWVIVIATLLSMFLSWGKNFMPLTDFFLDFVPGYNKFRSVSMILILAEFTIPLLAILAVDKILKTPDIFNKKIKLAFSGKEISMQNVFIVSFALTGGLSLLYYLMPDLTSFVGAGDDAIRQQITQSNGAEVAQRFMENIEEARKGLFKADAIRSFFFIVLAAAAVWLYLKGKVNQVLLIAALGIVVLVDLWTVDKNFLNDKNFVSKQDAKVPFTETPADRAILADTDPDYRVLNLAVNTFNDASTSYYHKSIGGYHPAKLRRYQDLIEHNISSEMQNIIGTLQRNPTDSALREAFEKNGVLNMLNTRYIIYNPEAEPLKNRYALGNAWFVTDVKMVKNADEEIATLGKINPAQTALVDERFKEELTGYVAKPDYSASIKLTDYKPNHLSYESNASSEQLAVFSEIHYEDGWNAYIDGQKKPYIRVDYILRAMRIPAGKHNIEFKFEPTKFYTRQTIALASSIVLFAFLGWALFVTYKEKEGEVR